MKHNELTRGVVYYVKDIGLVLCHKYGVAYLPVMMGEDLSKEELEKYQFYPIDVAFNTKSYNKKLVDDICDSVVIPI